VDVATSGPFAATANTGYVANSDSTVEMVLPASALLTIGDTVRVSGGRSGWSIAGSEGQSIRSAFEASTYAWTARETNRAWSETAVSGNGQYLIATTNTGDQVRSTNFGATWNRTTIVYRSVSASTSGTTLVGIRLGGGSPSIGISYNFGGTWSADVHVAPVDAWNFVATAGATGCVIAIGARQNEGRRLYVGTDISLTQVGPSANWRRAATSADCTRFAAVTEEGILHTSTDGGVTWTVRRSGLSTSGLVLSDDGRMMAVTGAADVLHTSADSGLTWLLHPVHAGATLSSLSMSQNGRLAVTTSGNSQVYTSNNFGETWTAQDSPREWTSVALSGDGTRVLAAPIIGQLYVGSAATAAASTIAGPASAAVELQYIGSDTFRVLSHEGALSSY